MNRISTFVHRVVGPYLLLGQLVFCGVKSIVVLIRHYPIHTLFVATLTGVFTFMAITLLPETGISSLLPIWMNQLLVPCIGISFFIGFLSISIHLLPKRSNG